ncbi:MAG: PEGA domain-containing protein [Acidobacteria bacterium]|nr:PEGA domain-containing protein [Acidobacteriota bacterium]
MKKIIYICFVMLLFVIGGCSFPYHYDTWGTNYDNYRIILLVTPDDANVLLDGKFIGEAYEFATREEPLQLHSLNHELVIKKEGYREELINLLDYSTTNITIRLNLMAEKSYYQSQEKKRKVKDLETEMAETAKTGSKPGYVPVPKTEPENVPPLETEKNEDTDMKEELLNVMLEIAPKESSIYLNGKFWGIAPENGIIDNLRLEPGKYTLDIVKPGYHSIKKEFDIKGQDVKLSIKLEKIN